MARFDKLDVMGDAIGDVYADCVDRLLVNLARHFKYLQPGEEPGGAFRYQVEKLAEFGQVNRESVKIIRDMLGDVPEELADGQEQAILDALGDVEPALRKAAESGLLNPKGSLGGFSSPLELKTQFRPSGETENPPDFRLPEGAGARSASEGVSLAAVDVPQFSPRAMRAFRLYHGQSVDRMNLVNSTMLQSTAEAYRGIISDITNKLAMAQRTINAATGQVVGGVESFNQALKLATDRLIRSGLTGFVDGGGHRWAPETYVSMVMRSTYHNVSREAFWERNEEYGNDLYLVSQHPGARPLCYPWQCKVISREDRARDVTDGSGQSVHVYAQSETTYGEPAGLFGINCGHHPELFIPGATMVPEVRQDQGENDRQYAESQKQRKLERDFRKARLQLAAAKAQGADDATLKAAREKLKQADQRLDRFTKQTGRKRRREREYEPAQAKWTEKALTGGGGSGTMNMNEGYFRRREHQNTGAFAKLKEPMTLSHAKKTMRQMGVLDKEISYKVDANEEYVGRGLFGHTSVDGKSVTFYPDAFKDKEQLVKTCGHETTHVQQVRQYGPTEDMIDLVQREQEAFEREAWYWEDYQKRMGLK